MKLLARMLEVDEYRRIFSTNSPLHTCQSYVNSKHKRCNVLIPICMEKQIHAVYAVSPPQQEMASLLSFSEIYSEIKTKLS
jgi:hypothetical protein